MQGEDTDPHVAPGGYMLVPVFSSGAAISGGGVNGTVTVKGFGP